MRLVCGGVGYTAGGSAGATGFLLKRRIIAKMSSAGIR
jgi:hypothetical protein